MEPIYTVPRAVRFTCVQCKLVVLVSGGSSNYKCESCQPHSAAYKAHSAVAVAIRSGRLTQPSEYPCADCGGVACQYDHRDYRKPLAVDPVCRKCNSRRGPAIQPGGFVYMRRPDHRTTTKA